MAKKSNAIPLEKTLLGPAIIELREKRQQEEEEREQQRIANMSKEERYWYELQKSEEKAEKMLAKKW